MPKSQLETTLESIGVTSQATLLGYVCEDHKKGGWSHFAWQVTLKRGTIDGYTTSYRTGIGHAKPLPKPTVFRPDLCESDRVRAWFNKPGTAIPPTVADVVASCLSDSNSAADTFEDFCDSLDYDTDSRKALETYLQCQAIGKHMRRLLGEHYLTVCGDAQDY
jgi:hypothetical protein